MKKFLIQLILIISPLFASAQQMPDVTLVKRSIDYLNPGATGNKEALAANIMFKKQWISITGAPIFEAFTATLDYSNGKLNQVRLLPVDLQFDSAYKIRGQPLYAKSEHGRRIIEQVAKLSSKYGTKIRYDEESNQGLVELS